MGIAVKEEVDSSAGTMFNICVLVHAVSTKPNTIFNIQTAQISKPVMLDWSKFLLQAFCGD